MSDSDVLDDDRELVRRCLLREAAGVRDFVDRFQRPVFGLCYRMLGHHQDAEDVAQEVLIRAIRHLSHWDASRPLAPWVYTIAANRCRTTLGQRAKLPIPSELTDGAPAAPAPPPDTGLAEELQRGLATLREEYRLCFVMFHQQELSCAQIGAALGCPEGTVKTWLHRARKELAAWLKKRGLGPERREDLT